jgi:hypothetical protein
MERRDGCSEYRDQGIVKSVLLLFAGFADFLLNHAESVGDVCFLWWLIDIRKKESVDSLERQDTKKRCGLRKS